MPDSQVTSNPGHALAANEAWPEVDRRGEVCREDIRCYALYRAVNAGRAGPVIGRLSAGNAVRFVSAQAPREAGRPAQRWPANPALLSRKIAVGNAGNPRKFPSA